ncbi:MAG: thioredoxin family protein [Planctomycetes bacterium]|nr:thioredoxin family protein [Planctomycetota bacterium]
MKMTDQSRFRCVTVFVLAVLYSTELRNAAWSAEPASKSVRWSNNFTEAKKTARRLKRPLLVHFYAGWCKPCRRMERETLHSRQLAKQIGDRFIAVKVNTDREAGLVKRYGISVLPTDLIIDSSGRTVSRTEGYQSRQRFLANVVRIEASLKRARKVTVVRNGKPRTGTAAPSVAPGKKKPAKTTSPQGAVRLGMRGYSPVTLWNHRRWLAGKSEFSSRYKGVTYRMASAFELRQFEKEPRRFAPRLLGCDPVVIDETDRALAGNIECGAFFDGKLFFFINAASRKKFRSNPLRYTMTRHVLRVNEFGATVRR